MIDPRITLQQVDDLYKLAGLNEIFVYPWFQDGNLVGLITGLIDVYPPYPGKTGWLQHFILLPWARDRWETKLQMVRMAHAHAALAGCERVTISIKIDDARREWLGEWAVAAGYTKTGELDGYDWFVKSLTTEDNGKEQPQDGSASGTPAAAASPAPGS